MISKEYWQKRETEHAKKNKMSEQTYAEEIRKTYAYMADQIQKEIDGFYAKYAKAEKISLAEAKRRVSKLDIEEYGRKAAKYVKEKDFSDQANEEMLLYNATMKINRLELLKANIGLEMVSGFDELQKYFDQTLTQQAIEEFRRQAGILGNSVQENGKMARTIVDASFHNATYSDRIWMYQDMLKAELDKLLKTGLIQGKNPRELAVHLQKRFGASREDAERLMVTELARVQTEAQKHSYLRNGFEEYTYVACGNADVCERCQALDGRHFRVQDMMPGTNAPPMHPRCHCSTAAYADSEEYEKWLNFLDKGGTTEEWELLEKNTASDIMELTRKTSNSREGFKFISDKTFDNLTIAARKKGAVIMRGTEEVERHLDSMGAAASNLNDILLFRKNVCISEVLEETHHFEQNLMKLNDDKTEPLRSILNEIDAKQYLLDNAEKYKIPRNEIELTKKQLASYRKQLEEMLEE